jgi:hypothetical protein
MHIVRGAQSNYFSRIYGTWTCIFVEKYIVFATPPKPLWRILMKLGTKKDHDMEMDIL